MSKKRIWIYWQQGFENAPEIVKLCAESWKTLNPDYEVTLLDESNLGNFISIPREFNLSRKPISLQLYSDFIRLELLTQHGGVWVDSTVYCAKSLNEWLPEYSSQNDFFVFQSPGKDRLISSWFISSSTDSGILNAWHRSFTGLFRENTFSNQDTRLGNYYLKKYRRYNRRPKRTLKWQSWFARKILKVYPYFIVHYTFNKIILTEKDLRPEWENVKPFSATLPHLIQTLPQEANSVETLQVLIESKTIPMFKLTWRIDTDNSYWSDILKHLQDRLNVAPSPKALSENSSNEKAS